MTTPKETAKTSSDYQKAEKMIDRAIAKMEEESHIEYGSTIVHNDKPVRLKWCRRLIDKWLKRH